MTQGSLQNVCLLALPLPHWTSIDVNEARQRIESHTTHVDRAHEAQELPRRYADDAKVHRGALCVLTIPRNVTAFLSEHFVHFVAPVAGDDLDSSASERRTRATQGHHAAWCDRVFLPVCPVTQKARKQRRLILDRRIVERQGLAGVYVEERRQCRA